MITATWRGNAVSDNRRLIQRGGRWIANPAYKAFKEEMAWGLKGASYSWHKDSSVVRVSVILRVFLPPRMDVSAIVKAALDAVQLSGIVKDDNQVDRLEVIRCGTSKKGESSIVFEIDTI
jgi:Holliday junction resolvase RusA-like endonuclease